MRNLCCLVLAILISTNILFAKGIDFHKDILDEALVLAKAKGKYVFIDTYAQWCAPCKRMNKVFDDPRVGSLYNEKFVNVKINMDGILGKYMLIKYDVVWLPTLLILDQDGNVKYRVDKEVRAEDLLRMAEQALDPNFRFYQAPVYASSPVLNNVAKSARSGIVQPATSQIIEEEDDSMLGVKDLPQKEERILYVFDENVSSADPEILYHEAYLRMQLMDSKMHEIADKYLNTQTNWATEKNVKFIFDFVENTKSKYFRFFRTNIPLFEKYLGAERVRQNLELMIYNRLNSGFPRPNLAESIGLYELLDKEKGKDKAYLYYLNGLNIEGNELKFNEVAEKYIEDVNPYNYAVLKNLVDSKLALKQKGLPKYLKFIDRALEKDKQNPELLLLKSKILYTLNDAKKARIIAEDALDGALDRSENTAEIEEFQSKISPKRSR